MPRKLYTHHRGLRAVYGYWNVLSVKLISAFLTADGRRNNHIIAIANTLLRLKTRKVSSYFEW